MNDISYALTALNVTRLLLQEWRKWLYTDEQCVPFSGASELNAGNHGDLTEPFPVKIEGMFDPTQQFITDLPLIAQFE